MVYPSVASIATTYRRFVHESKELNPPAHHSLTINTDFSQELRLSQIVSGSLYSIVNKSRMKDPPSKTEKTGMLQTFWDRCATNAG